MRRLFMKVPWVDPASHTKASPVSLNWAEQKGTSGLTEKVATKASRMLSGRFETLLKCGSRRDGAETDGRACRRSRLNDSVQAGAGRVLEDDAAARVTPKREVRLRPQEVRSRMFNCSMSLSGG